MCPMSLVLLLLQVPALRLQTVAATLDQPAAATSRRQVMTIRIDPTRRGSLYIYS